MRRFALAFIVLSMLAMTGCSNSENTTTVKQEETEMETNAFPYGDLKYVDDTFELTSVNTYSGESISEHGYNAYVFLRFDISGMSEDGKYWMLKNQNELELIKTFETEVKITCADNNLNSVRMNYWGKEITDDYIYLSYMSDECRNEFTAENTQFEIDLTVYQTDKVSGDSFEKKWEVNTEGGELFLPMLDFDEFTGHVEDDIRNGKGNELNK